MCELMPEAIREDGSRYELDQHPAVLTQNTGETVVNQIMGLTDAGGNTTWLQINTHSLGLDRHGKPVAVVLSFADVTRLKLIEDELRRNEKNLRLLSQQFKGVLEAIPDQILVLDQELDIVWLNRQHGQGAGRPGRVWRGSPAMSCPRCSAARHRGINLRFATTARSSGPLRAAETKRHRSP